MSPLFSLKMTSASKRWVVLYAKVTLLHSTVNWRLGAVPVVDVRIAADPSTNRSSWKTSKPAPFHGGVVLPPVPPSGCHHHRRGLFPRPGLLERRLVAGGPPCHVP